MAVTPRQISALKYMIFSVDGASNLTKRVYAYLLDHSELLTKEVCVCVRQDENYSTQEIHQAECSVTDFNCHSKYGGILLGELMIATGSDFSFSCHSGYFIQGLPHVGLIHMKDWKDVRSGTFWLAKSQHAKTARLLTPTYEELAGIDLSKSGLYPTSEQVQAT